MVRSWRLGNFGLQLEVGGEVTLSAQKQKCESIFGKPVFYSNLVERVTDDIISVSGALNGTSFKIL